VLLVYDDRIESLPYGQPVPAAQTQPRYVLAGAREIDHSRASAEWFFRYIQHCWASTAQPSPDNFVIINDHPALWPNKEPRT